jgi:hypothetical protein
MYGRFVRRSTQEVLADWFGVELEDLLWFAPSYNVVPQSFQPVVRLASARTVVRCDSETACAIN